MSVTDQEIKEIDVVSFKEAVDGWPAGTRGTVVIDHGDVKTIEISDDLGQTLDLPAVSVEKLELVEKYSD
jgi:hypothetical protein